MIQFEDPITKKPREQAGIEHIPKVVCVPCYLLAFGRVYPNAALPPMSLELLH